MKTFIRAERLHDWDLHLPTVVDTLPIFAAAGHGQYAKGGRLYLEMMDRHALLNKPLIDIFKFHGLHTVRYSEHQWCGVWTDLSIEQKLMRAVKSSGGLIGGKLRNQKSAHKVWVSTLNHFSLINERFIAFAEAQNKKALQ